MARSVSCAYLAASMLLLPATACVRAPPSEAVAAPPESSRYIITEDEISEVEAQSAYDIIKKLRANFLSYRGETSFYDTSSPEPTVYVDDQMYGPIGVLASIPAQQVASIRLYRAWEATTKFGTGNMGGVIAVYTKR